MGDERADSFETCGMFHLPRFRGGTEQRVDGRYLRLRVMSGPFGDDGRNSARLRLA